MARFTKEESLKKAEQQLKLAEARMKRAKAAVKAQDRKLETRRLILIGAELKSRASKSKDASDMISELISGMNEKQRQAFHGFEVPKPVEKTVEKPVEAASDAEPQMRMRGGQNV